MKYNKIGFSILGVLSLAGIVPAVHAASQQSFAADLAVKTFECSISIAPEGSSTFSATFSIDESGNGQMENHSPEPITVLMKTSPECMLHGVKIRTTFIMDQPAPYMYAISTVAGPNVPSDYAVFPVNYAYSEFTAFTSDDGSGDPLPTHGIVLTNHDDGPNFTSDSSERKDTPDLAVVAVAYGGAYAFGPAGNFSMVPATLSIGGKGGAIDVGQAGLHPEQYGFSACVPRQCGFLNADFGVNIVQLPSNSRSLRVGFVQALSTDPMSPITGDTAVELLPPGANTYTGTIMMTFNLS